MIPLSILDLAPITQGSNAAQSFKNTLEIAQQADRLGYNRYWLAEHHSIPGIASAATSVVIGYVAAGTRRIRVGSGGIMLPNHSPLVIAEQFGTLESLFPGRIDLGLGRAPGSDQITARALRRNLNSDEGEFPRDVVELMGYLGPPVEGQKILAVPGQGLKVPLWILGSSLFGAQLAAALGLPYAFASHFAPGQMMQAIEIYRARFQPSEQLQKPYLMMAFNVFAAESDDEGRLLATSMQQSVVNLRSGRLLPLQPPVEDYSATLSPPERGMIDQMLSCTAAGTGETIAREMTAFVERTGADELIINSQIFDHAARMHSFAITAEVAKISR
ncbi:MAG: LLM class flavin-dependent oxidoreductase [Gammaproteobacteria bacterium]|nr:LLM class flavin-dependent oxidoreductase [Gammaproteobacteria bacterium]